MLKSFKSTKRLFDFLYQKQNKNVLVFSFKKSLHDFFFIFFQYKKKIVLSIYVNTKISFNLLFLSSSFNPLKSRFTLRCLFLKKKFKSYLYILKY